MKCPKCGYLGFETTDRCRNCQYDFSLAPFKTEAELSLHAGTRAPEAPLDFDLAPIGRAADTPPSSALDLDRLFGDPEPTSSAAAPAGKSEIAMLEGQPEVAALPASSLAMALDDDAQVAEESEAERRAASDTSALPFEDSPLVPPPAARPPLAVRRSTPELPRNRPRMTRPIRSVSLDFESTRADEPADAVSETIASLMESPSLVTRITAGVIDSMLLLGIDAAVVYLTLRVTGLQNTLDDLRVLPAIPFVGFLLVLAFGYVAAFTVAGGQTIGKMTLRLRVIGDDGRRVDAAGGMIRALGCMLVPMTLGLSYLPAVFTSDHRALHDRLAGTRVVRE
jgi:uncharacterized RDD family membrane protein YckC